MYPPNQLETRFVPFVDKPDTFEDAEDGEASRHEELYCDECGCRLEGTGYVEVQDVGEKLPEQLAHPMFVRDTWMACSRQCADKLIARYAD